ncbi:MAG: RT0821/Lpp0805 family surface protein [Desulfuromusa sp.]|nr:RT0821/Lpp0805 family surface protein [Desulfuromusa sp.]
MKYIIILTILFTASIALAEHRSSIYLLTNSDAVSLSGGFHYALSKSPNHQAVDWTNPATGLSGSTLPIKSYRTSYGQVCREYLSTIQLDGATQQAFGTACRQADGSWKIAGQKPVKRAQQALHFVYVKESRQQTSQRPSFAFKHPPIKQSNVGQMKTGQNYHSDHFHEKIRTLKRGSQPAPEQRRIEPKQPTKLLKMVAY